MNEQKNDSEKKPVKPPDHVVILPPEVVTTDKTFNLDAKPNKQLRPAAEYAKWPGRTKFIPRSKVQNQIDNQEKDLEIPRRPKAGEDIDKVDPPLWLELTAAKHAKKVLKRLAPVAIDDKIAEILRAVKLTEVMCIDNTRHIERVYEALDFASSPYKRITSEKLKERPHCAAVYIHPIFLEFAVQKKIAKYPAKGGFRFRVNTTLTLSVRRRKFDYLHIAAEDGAAEIDIIPLEFDHMDYGNVKKVYYDLATTKANLPPGAKCRTCVVLPTGLEVDGVYMASMVSFVAGHQFVRVPATKISLYKNLKDLYAACRAVKHFSKHYYRIPGVKMGMEIRTLEEALAYMAMADEALGRKWVVREFFRLGTTYMLRDSAGALLTLIKMKH